MNKHLQRKWYAYPIELRRIAIVIGQSAIVSD